MTTTLYKSMAAFVAATMLMLAIPAFAATSPNWTLNPNTAITFVCGGGNYPHTLDTVTNNPDGSFTGTGHNAPNTTTWTVSGQIDGNTIVYTIDYDATTELYTNTGVIHSDGSISGTSSSNCQTFSSPAGTASAIIHTPTTKEACKNNGWKTLVDNHGDSFKNQGQCVSYVATKKGS